MVAATFPNVSFENPPGTGPTLLSSVAEPYSLIDGTSLTVIFAGATTNVVVLESDFADITAATAAELAALVELRVDDLGASDDGGFLRLTSLLTGEDVSLRVQAGGVNDIVGFSTTEVTGETYAGGPPDGWAVASEDYSSVEYAEFADENGRPEEIFDGNDEWPLVTVSDEFEFAIFDTATIPAPFETFTAWSAYGVLTSIASEAASFDSTLEVFEDFENEWGEPLYFAFLPVHLEDAGFNPETFETDWGQEVGSPTYDSAEFASGSATVDTFNDVVTHTHMITVNDAQAGEEYRVTINGVTVRYIAQGGDTENDIASNLADAVSNGLVIADGGYVILTPIFVIIPDSPDRALSVQVAGPSSGSIEVVLSVDHPLTAEEWVGQDNNPDFD